MNYHIKKNIYSLITLGIFIFSCSAVLFLESNGSIYPTLVFLGAALFVGTSFFLIFGDSFREKRDSGRFYVQPAREPPPAEHSPIYSTDPSENTRNPIKWGCAPLVDCCAPYLFSQADPKGWDALCRSRGLDIQFEFVHFDNLPNQVVNGRIDVAVGSLLSVFSMAMNLLQAPPAHQSKFPIRLNLPPLQQFNCYYIFAKRQAVSEFLIEKNLLAVTNLQYATANNSLHRTIRGGGRQLLRQLLKTASIPAEAGADLEAILRIYFGILSAVSGEVKKPGSAEKLNISSTPIDIGFRRFLKSKDLTLFIGGIAETSYLLGRCDPDDEYILIADPADMTEEAGVAGSAVTPNYVNNFNGMIVREEDLLNRRADIYNVTDIWFDSVDWYRRNFIFDRDRDPDTYKSLEKLLRKTMKIDDESVSIVPSQLKTAEDWGLMMDFLKVQDPSSGIGSFLIPNRHSANEVSDLYELENKYQAAVAGTSDPAYDKIGSSNVDSGQEENKAL